MRAGSILVALVGCGGSGSDAPMDAPIDAAPFCTHLQNLRVVRGKALTFGTVGENRYEGSICVDGRADLGCAMANSDRDFEICAPSMADFGLRFTKTGFENTVFLHGPGTAPMAETFRIGDDAYVGPKIWTKIGGPYPTDASRGNLAVHVFKVATDGSLAPLENAMMATVPSNGVTVRYFGADGADPTLNATSLPTTIALVGNVPIGEYDIQINSATHPNCTQLTGGFESPDNSQDARVPILGATTTVVVMKCVP